MRYAVFGGTFDPPHNGHLAVARAVHAGLQVDEVLLVPASRNPLKREGPVATAADRLAMCVLLAREEPWLAVSDFEVSEPGPSYAIDTLEAMKLTRPGDYWFVLGADSFRDFARWKDPMRLVRLCRLALVERNRVGVERLLAEVDREVRRVTDVVPMPEAPVSSSKIRERLAKGLNIDDLVPAAVADHIEQGALYRD